MSHGCTPQQLDPRTLLLDVDLRAEARPGKALVASIRDARVLVPVRAQRTSNGDIRVRYGRRRILAAIEAGRETVPVLVFDAEDDHSAGIVAQITDRGGVPLPASDRINLIGQLSKLGMSAAQIARRTRSSRKDVDAAVLAASSKLAVQAASRFEFLTLDQAAAVAEFDDDKVAVRRLIVTAQRNPVQFDEVLSWQRERRARLDQARANLDRSEPAAASDGAADDHSARIMVQMTDNHDRAPLPAKDQIKLFGQLSMLGTSAGQIARRTKTARKDVQAGILAASSKLAVEAVRRYEFLTLDQAAAIAEFDDDKLAVSALIVAAHRNPSQFEEVLEWQRGRPGRLDKVRANRDQIDRAKVILVRIESSPDPQTAAYVENYYRD
jgi:ParB-like chromosome segregation protein Spo0J